MTSASSSVILSKLGTAVVNDTRISSKPWTSLALLAESQGREVSGYRFFDQHEWGAQAPYDIPVLDLFETLHAAMKAEGNDWKCALFTIKRSDMQLNVDFEYDDPDRWKFTVQGVESIKAYAMSLRPD